MSLIFTISCPQLLSWFNHTSEWLKERWRLGMIRDRTSGALNHGIKGLPIPGHSLHVWYCGPYIIKENVNEVDCIVMTPEWWKQRTLCHISMLKAYIEKSCIYRINDYCSWIFWGGGGSSEVTMSRSELRMKKSKVLANLEKKLSHLPEKAKACRICEPYPGIHITVSRYTR